MEHDRGGQPGTNFQRCSFAGERGAPVPHRCRGKTRGAQGLASPHLSAVLPTAMQLRCARCETFRSFALSPPPRASEQVEGCGGATPFRQRAAGISRRVREASESVGGNMGCHGPSASPSVGPPSPTRLPGRRPSADAEKGWRGVSSEDTYTPDARTSWGVYHGSRSISSWAGHLCVSLRGAEAGTRLARPPTGLPGTPGLAASASPASPERSCLTDPAARPLPPCRLPSPGYNAGWE